MRSFWAFSFFIYTLGLFTNMTYANDETRTSCWPEFTSVNIDIPKVNSEIKFPYFSQNVQGLYETEVQGNVELVGEKLVVSASYPNVFGLPFVVYAVILFNDGRPIYFEDFTKNCSSPAINLFPGDRQEVVFLKNQPQIEGSLKLIIWGR